MAEDTNLNCRAMRNPKVQTILLPDGFVSLINEQGIVHTLTPWGGIAWEFCDGQLTVEEIGLELSALNDAQPSADEVYAMIQKLAQANLLSFI